MTTERLTLPVLPLREVVLFPGVTTPIGAGRPATLRAIEAAVRTESRHIFAVSQTENVDRVTPAGLHTMGTVATITQVQRGIAGVQIILHGEVRATALQYTDTGDYLQAVIREVQELPPLKVDDPAFVALHREVRERAAELGRKSGLPEDVVKQLLEGVTEPGRLADLVAGYIDIKPTERQSLLETLAAEERLRRVLVHVQRQIGVIDAQEDIKSKVQEELGERQREMFLREQMKAIQNELGEGDEGNELEDLKKRFAELDLPEAARKEVDRELARLERAGRESMEAQVIRTYLETMAELPWGKRAEESLDLKRAAEILEEDHYGLSDVKDEVLEFLAVRQLRGKQPKDKDGGENTTKGSILLFVGPPGVGKTSIAKSIARAMGRPYVRISLGGARDEADIRGHRRTYVGAMPGRIIQGMKQAGAKNPIFLLDEVDKLGVSFQGDPASALLEVLDPAQNDSFTDHYLGVPFDLSEVLFVATANFLQSIPAPLLDRLEVVNFAGYTEREKLEIAKRYLVPRQLHRKRPDRRPADPDRSRAERRGVALHARSRRAAAGARNRQARPQSRAPHRHGRNRNHHGWSRRHRRPARPSQGTPGAEGGLGSDRRRHRHVLHAGRRRHHVRRSIRDARARGAGAHRAAGRRHEGIRPRCPDLRQVAPRTAGYPRRRLGGYRRAHPRTGGRHPQGWSVGRRHHGNGARVRVVTAAGAP